MFHTKKAQNFTIQSLYSTQNPQKSADKSSKKENINKKMKISGSERKKVVPALQDVGGSFCRSLSSFKIRFDAITYNNKKLKIKNSPKHRSSSSSSQTHSHKNTKLHIHTQKNRERERKAYLRDPCGRESIIEWTLFREREREREGFYKIKTVTFYFGNFFGSWS